jgi:hypothetical protein
VATCLTDPAAASACVTAARRGIEQFAPAAVAARLLAAYRAGKGPVPRYDAAPEI